jgi:hypothetical protein
MSDSVEFAALKQRIDRFGVANVRLAKNEIPIVKVRRNVAAFDLGRVKRIEIVDNGNFPNSFGQQTIDEMRPDKSGSASYQNMFFPHY